MANGPRASTTAWTSDDSGYVAVVGLVLVLAIVVGAYAKAVTTDVPRWGAEAERAWEHDVLVAMGDVARATSSLSTNGQKASIPPAPQPRALDVPLIGRTAPVPASGAVTFDGGCAAFAATHTSAAGDVIEDLVGAAPGCVAFHGTMAYSPSFSYVIEFGGVVRVQGERAVVLHGPPIDVVAEDGVHRVTLGMSSLTGLPASVSAEGTTNEIQVSPTSLTPERAFGVNALQANWEFETAHAAAWKLWFENELRDEGLAPDDHFTVSCVPADCASSTSEPGIVSVALFGEDEHAEDLAVAVAHGRYVVQVS